MDGREKLREFARQLENIRRREADRPGLIDWVILLTMPSVALGMELFKKLSSSKEKRLDRRKYYKLILDKNSIPEDTGIIEIRTPEGNTVGYVVPSDLDDSGGSFILEAIELYKRELKKG